MQRVMITGGPGSGKSTLARHLGGITGLPVYHMDHIHWTSGWVERSRAEKTAMTEAVHAKDKWILEGGHSATYQSRIARADTFIWLDLPVSLRLWRVCKRTFKFLGQSRPDLPEGCVERLNADTLEFAKFIWRTRKTSRAKLAALKETARRDLHVHHLRSLAEIKAFYCEVSQRVTHSV